MKLKIKVLAILMTLGLAACESDGPSIPSSSNSGDEWSMDFLVNECNNGLGNGIQVACSSGTTSSLGALAPSGTFACPTGDTMSITAPSSPDHYFIHFTVDGSSITGWDFKEFPTVSPNPLTFTEADAEKTISTEICIAG